MTAVPSTVVPPIDVSFVGERSGSTHTVEIEGEAVVLDESSDRLHLLNHTAALVWRCLDGTSTIESICEDLASELNAPLDVVIADTLRVAGNLFAEGLVDAIARSTASGELTEPRYWHRCDGVLWRQSLDAVVLLAPGEDEPIVLRGGGPAVWERLESPVTIEDLVRDLAAAHGSEEAQVEADVLELLDRLEAAGAVAVN